MNVLRLFLLLFVISSFVSPAVSKEISISKDNGIYHIILKGEKIKKKIKFVSSDALITNKEAHQKSKAKLTVNAGFFDVKNGKTVSYVTIDNKLVGDVKKHPALIKSLENEKRLDKVLSRGELRILNKKNHLKFDIVSHNAPVKKGYTIKHAIQAGPIIYPDMDLEGEGFIITEDGIVKFQSVDILKRRERTVIGLKGKWLYIVIFTHDHMVDVNEMRDYMQGKLKLNKILAFDGGLSTAVNYKDISIGSLGKHQRKVKTFLVIER